MVKLKGFKDHAIARFMVFEPPMTGKDLTRVVEEAMATPAADVAKVTELLKKYTK